ncbi:hypothetical protein [Sporomusa malonica]|uniref:Uncharacterized protein n=1 Tax=Sporomusa malonica TaxID=112901 RepID=A0A1W2BBB1_9FIRM|nr:hypothetical protein [Sporomusa malonica]SMC69992.1 hypothetical protein SAMN04488500_10723 [Sporomusa malonica]
METELYTVRELTRTDFRLTSMKKCVYFFISKRLIIHSLEAIPSESTPVRRIAKAGGKNTT